jgi:hypothetical protein
MRVGIDSYCYHHYFGEIYSGLETDPGRRFSRENFLEKSHAFGVAGVSPELCFFPAPDARLATDIRSSLDSFGLDRIWAWGTRMGFIRLPIQLPPMI